MYLILTAYRYLTVLAVSCLKLSSRCPYLQHNTDLLPNHTELPKNVIMSEDMNHNIRRGRFKVVSHLK